MNSVSNSLTMTQAIKRCSCLKYCIDSLFPYLLYLLFSSSLIERKKKERGRMNPWIQV